MGSGLFRVPPVSVRDAGPRERDPHAAASGFLMPACFPPTGLGRTPGDGKTGMVWATNPCRTRLSTPDPRPADRPGGRPADRFPKPPADTTPPSCRRLRVNANPLSRDRLGKAGKLRGRRVSPTPRPGDPPDSPPRTPKHGPNAPFPATNAVPIRPIRPAFRPVKAAECRLGRIRRIRGPPRKLSAPPGRTPSTPPAEGAGREPGAPARHLSLTMNFAGPDRSGNRGRPPHPPPPVHAAQERGAGGAASASAAGAAIGANATGSPVDAPAFAPASPRSSSRQVSA